MNVADLPVKRALGGLHFIADLTPPYGRVLVDYLAA
jgi:acetoacetate decarboxylase